jgi:hypothetical protein
MRSSVAGAVLVTLLIGLAPPARAGSATDIALGLASFAVFNQVVAPLLRPETVVRRREVIYHQHPTVVYAPPPPVIVQPPASSLPSPAVVQYPHGRYELRLEGLQYVWVWIPTVSPPPPPPPPAP